MNEEFENLVRRHMLLIAFGRRPKEKEKKKIEAELDRDRWYDVSTYKNGIDELSAWNPSLENDADACYHEDDTFGINYEHESIRSTPTVKSVLTSFCPVITSSRIRS